jgi:hypothetical protein
VVVPSQQVVQPPHTAFVVLALEGPDQPSADQQRHQRYVHDLHFAPHGLRSRRLQPVNAPAAIAPFPLPPPTFRIRGTNVIGKCLKLTVPLGPVDFQWLTEAPPGWTSFASDAPRARGRPAPWAGLVSSWSPPPGDPPTPSRSRVRAPVSGARLRSHAELGSVKMTDSTLARRIRVPPRPFASHSHPLPLESDSLMIKTERVVDDVDDDETLSRPMTSVAA